MQYGQPIVSVAAHTSSPPVPSNSSQSSSSVGSYYSSPNSTSSRAEQLPSGSGSTDGTSSGNTSPPATAGEGSGSSNSSQHFTQAAKSIAQSPRYASSAATRNADSHMHSPSAHYAAYRASPADERMTEAAASTLERVHSGAGPATKSRRMVSPSPSRSADAAFQAAYSSSRAWEERGAAGSSGAAAAGSSSSGSNNTPHAHSRASPRAPPRESSSYDSTSPQARPVSPPHLDLASYPPQNLLRVLATLLHQIATANDELRPSGTSAGEEARRRGASSRAGKGRETDEAGGADGRPPSASTSSASSSVSGSTMRAPEEGHRSGSSSRQGRPPITTASLGALGAPSSTLCFHARNVPSISIESYLLRILKYCPTTNEVFLSLLVYFDRMSRMGLGAGPGSSGTGSPAGTAAGLPIVDGEVGLAASTSSLRASAEDLIDAEPHPGMRGFAIDSYNVHRLVIAGVTVASKFFSDVFYTNSRYAKVGGLPVHELNQLELQFLLLNDFRLVIPLDEMQRYADQLLVYGSGRSPPRSRELGAPQAPASGAADEAAQQQAQQDVAMRDA